MVEFGRYYVVVRRHLAALTGLRDREITFRLNSPDCVTLYEYVRPEKDRVTRLEYDRDFFWRVVITNNLAPDGIKHMAYVVAGIKYDHVLFPPNTRSPAKVVNALLNAQYAQHVNPVQEAKRP